MDINNTESQQSSTNTEPVTAPEPVQEQVTPVAEEPPREETKREKVIAMITKVGNYLKIPLLKILNCSAFFIIVYLIGWVLNGVYNTLHFDLTALRDFYLMVIGKDVATHSVNSIFNSGFGQPYQQQNQIRGVS